MEIAKKVRNYDLLTFFSELQNFSASSQNVFKSASLVSMIKSSTENDRNLTSQIVAASFENGIGSTEVSGEKVWGFLTPENLIIAWRKLTFLRIL